MSITELCQHVGDDNIQCQIVSQSLVKGEVKKHDGEITFATDRDKVMPLCGVGKQTHVGFIVWLPVDRLPENMKPKGGA